ncbi:hypothetical protein [Anaerobiospirillum sp. NML120511]|uniref:hypothetical protein n=2 Tax=unclassified Anaerobiospirillum TaxID=2647410 RepID=UPI001FF13B6D|nr:hypothetical protein [Anaerobiospirillum sp. NML120511]MCK0534249.1 hypothetical protein [Anaerobiospirillum sp. NML120511]
MPDAHMSPQHALNVMTGQNGPEGHKVGLKGRNGPIPMHMELHMDMHDMAQPPDHKTERHLPFERLHYARGIQSHNNAHGLNAEKRILMCRYASIWRADKKGGNAEASGGAMA